MLIQSKPQNYYLMKHLITTLLCIIFAQVMPASEKGSKSPQAKANEPETIEPATAVVDSVVINYKMIEMFNRAEYAEQFSFESLRDYSFEELKEIANRRLYGEGYIPLSQIIKD